MTDDADPVAVDELLPGAAGGAGAAGKGKGSDGRGTGACLRILGEMGSFNVDVVLDDMLDVLVLVLEVVSIAAAPKGWLADVEWLALIDVDADDEAAGSGKGRARTGKDKGKGNEPSVPFARPCAF